MGAAIRCHCTGSRTGMTSNSDDRRQIDPQEWMKGFTYALAICLDDF
jgi:hypothetical protein